MLRNKSWKRKQVEKRDYNRILLTETLPYEVPIHFSNLGFYQKYKNKEFDIKSLPLPFSEIKGPTVPFSYEIRNGESKKRLLSIPHPINQIDFIDIYKRYAEKIAYLCSKSEFSLRYPSSTGSYFYEKSRRIKKQDQRVVDTVGEDEITENSSSFFSYERYNFVYKFYDSYEYCDLETRFRYLKKVDIKKCFYSIYTHTLSWAIKGLDFSKKNHSENSLAGLFDKTIRNCNYGETNGIVVGPEVSRIFSEIILQELDVKLSRSLFQKGLESNKDYAIRRYIDDYFVFSNSEAELKIITEELEDFLRAYKLHLNESKTEVMQRPFVSGETSAKASIAGLLEKHYESMYSSREGEDDRIKVFTKSFNVESKLSSIIKDYRVIVHEKGVYASSVCNYALTILFNKINELGENKKIDFDPSGRNFNNFVLVWCLFALYIFSLSVKPRACYIFSRFVIAIVKKFLKEENPYSENIKIVVAEKIADIISMNCNSEMHSLEMYDLAQLLRWMGPKYELNQEVFRKLVSINGEMHINYFGVMASIDYCRNINSRKELKNEVLDYVVEHLLKYKLSTVSAETFMLLCDVMSCPYIGEKRKKRACFAVVKKYWVEQEINQKKDNLDKSADKLFRFFKNFTGYWFYEWDTVTENSFEPKVLKRKELRTAY